MSHYSLSGFCYATCKLHAILVCAFPNSYQGNYHIDHEAGEPDPHVLDLNAELGQCDEFISTTLPKKEQQ